MRRISAAHLAISFVGVFLGAGFVSGQELWQFFGCFGVWGLLGFLVSTGIAVVVDYALLHLAVRSGTMDVGMLILPGDHPRLRKFVDLMQCMLLFGIVVIMVAGASSLLHGLTGWSLALCGMLFAVAVAAAAMFDLRGVVTAFSVLVPITALTAVILGVTILARHDFVLQPATGSVAVLMPNWWISGISYAAYNLFGSVAVLVTMAGLLPSKKSIGKGIGFGAGVLIVLTCCILAAMAAQPACGDAELPTAALATQIHPALGMVYNLLMGLGMFSSALSCVIALLNQSACHWPVIQEKRKVSLSIILLAAFALSLVGFGNLVGIVYPIFGYVSVPFLVLLVRNWWKHRKDT